MWKRYIIIQNLIIEMMDGYIIGAGGQARQVENIINVCDIKVKLMGFITKEDDSEKIVHGYKVFQENIIENLDSKKVLFFNGMGRPNRRIPIQKLESDGFSFLGLIHPRSTIGNYVKIGRGTVIQSGVQFMTDIKVGNYVLADVSSTIGHDVEIGDYTTISTGVNIAGGVKIGNGTWIGSGSVIIEGIEIGDNVLIGAGSIVTKNIEGNTLAYGSPAKIVKSIDDVSKALIK
jgi:sugar O-acyltransferase (sialic acid O-acetyltransferase NeuD family)